jgi:glycosyltransferase involved in cell wall biosynthesis
MQYRGINLVFFFINNLRIIVMSVLVSIIVPCYNQAQYLPDALKSVLDQTFHNWECIIVNDGSQDNTESVALKWCEKDPRFTYLNKINEGLCSARNFGISHSNAEYILPLDADDKISNNYLNECLISFQTNNNIKIVYGKGVKFGLINESLNLRDYSFDVLLTENMIFCSGMYRKSDWEKCGGYDVNMTYGLEDWEFWINLLKSGGEVIKNINCHFYYRIKEVSMRTELQSDINARYMMNRYIFEKYYNYYNIDVFDLYLENNMNREMVNKYVNSPYSQFTFFQIFYIFLNKIKYMLVNFVKK